MLPFERAPWLLSTRRCIASLLWAYRKGTIDALAFVTDYETLDRVALARLSGKLLTTERLSGAATIAAYTKAKTSLNRLPDSGQANRKDDTQ